MAKTIAVSDEVYKKLEKSQGARRELFGDNQA